jgi:hypothetical protein
MGITRGTAVALAGALLSGTVFLSVGGADAHDRHFEGRLDGDGPRFVLHIDRDGGRQFFRRFNFRGLMVPCSDGSQIKLGRSVRDRVRLDPDGHFRSEGLNGDRDDGRLVRVSGTVDRRAAHGRFQVFKELDAPRNAVCETGRLRWSATIDRQHSSTA